jgi:hypothetical protein
MTLGGRYLKELQTSECLNEDYSLQIDTQQNDTMKMIIIKIANNIMTQ